MTYITNLSATAFKGRNIDAALSRLVAITGPNASGKSAHMDALRIALIGHIPENGKTADANMALASGSRMIVQAAFDKGEPIIREFWRDGDSIKTAGPKKSICPALLDAGEYFGLTDAKRLEYIAARIELPETSGKEAILRELGNAIFECDKEVAKSIYATVEEYFRDDPTPDAIRKLTEKGGALPTLYTEWNTKAKDSVGAVRTIADLKNEEEVSAETIDTLRKTVSKLRGELDAANRYQGSVAEAAMNANRAADRREELSQILKTPAPEPAKTPERPSVLDSLEGHKAHLAELEAQIAKPIPKAEDYAYAASEEATAKIKDKNALEKLCEIDAQLAELAEMKCCPHCKSAGKTWKKHLSTSLMDQRSIAAQEAEKAALALVGASKKAEEAKKMAEEVKAATIVRDTAIKAADKTRQIIESINQRDSEWKWKVQKAEHENKSLQQRWQDAQESAKRELASLQGAEPVAEHTLAEAARRVREAKEALEQSSMDLEKAVQVQQDLKRQAESSEKHQQAKAYVEAITIAGKFLKEKQADNIKRLFDTLLEKANRYTQGILREPLAFHEGEIGYFDRGRFVRHHTFSGTEKALTYISVAAALSEQASPRIVLLDELGRLDRGNKAKIMERLRHAVTAKWIDQAILIDTEPTEVEGWQQIALG